jgi:hypothetical protein
MLLQLEDLRPAVPRDHHGLHRWSKSRVRRRSDDPQITFSIRYILSKCIVCRRYRELIKKNTEPAMQPATPPWFTRQPCSTGVEPAVTCGLASAA